MPARLATAAVVAPAKPEIATSSTAASRIA
jgi:hypothetical protein